MACFAEDHEEWLLALDEFQQYACVGERLEHRVRHHVQRTLRAHREGVTQGGLQFGRPDGRHHDFVRTTSLLDPQCLFDRDLVEGIDAELHAIEHHAGAVRLHANAHVVVDDAFDCDENPSGLSSHWKRV